MLLCYGTTLLVSSMLLFFVQPMVGKMFLPALGGTPATWNTCMVFFQGALLAGYAYAHGTVNWLGVRRQAVLHMLLLLLPLAMLPIAIQTDSRPPDDANPALWLLWRLLVTVGPPFFVVSASGPLFAKWFASIGHRASADPYFLYATSNAGSLTALLGYPLVAERLWPLKEQSLVWFGGYLLLIVLTLVCAIAVWRKPASGGHASDERPADAPPSSECGAGSHDLTLRTRAWWVVLAFVPSSLMLGVTTHITTNLAAVPLLWVVPLAIYLLTFILVFARRQLWPRTWMVRLLPYVILPTGVLIFVEPPHAQWLAVPMHLVLLFVASMVLHGELAGRRPATKHLTAFFLWMSVGGVLGGIFNALVSPLVFDTILEYPLVTVLVCLLLPGSAMPKPRSRQLDFALPAGLALLAGATVLALRASPWSGTWMSLMLVTGTLVFLCFTFKERPVRFGLGYAVMLMTVSWYAGVDSDSVLHVERNFFGVKRVVIDPTGRFRMFVHGTTSHGFQHIAPARAGEPLTYYYRTGPVGDIFTAFSGDNAKSRVAVLGLGIGSIAAYAEPGQHFTFYEIDPAVERIARDRQNFTCLSGAQGTHDVVLGDGRLVLAETPDGRLGMIVLDTFSSDAIPTHILSREALKMYLTKLDDTGILVVNISNRFLDLEPLLAALARDAGLICLTRADTRIGEEEKTAGKRASQWVVMARRAEDLKGLDENPRWAPARYRPDLRVWTDQYCDILSLFRRAAPESRNN